MGNTECGIKVVKAILEDIAAKHVSLPTEYSLKYISERIGCTPQDIGMSFDSYIKKPLQENQISATKCGTPRVIMIKKI